MKSKTPRQQGAGVNLLAVLGQRNIEAHRPAAQFYRLFGAPLSRFWDSFTGFDIVRFDALINLPANQTLRAGIKAKHGEEAAMLIERLLRLF